MALDPYTTEVMKRLPAALRPGPYNLQEPAMAAAARGWSAQDFVTAIMNDRPTQPGHIISTARIVAQTPPPAKAGDNTTGPCQQACDEGWHTSQDGHSVVPCPTCRPDTHKRITLREQARTRGANHTQLNKIMVEQAADGPVPHTYPVRTPHHAEPQTERQHNSLAQTQGTNPSP